MGISIDEKRVYDASEGPTPVYVVGEFGVARVNTSDDLVGEFGLSRQCSARDAAGHEGRIAVATDEDVLVATADAENETFDSLGVGPAVAVGYAGEELLVAHEDGKIRREDGGVHPEEGTIRREDDKNWTDLGELTDVRAIDGDLLATESGVHKATETGLRHVGLDDARDVAGTGMPLAATADGLYKLGNGWLDELSGDFRVVSATAESDSGSESPGWAHAASADGLFARDEHGSRENSEWHEVDLPVEGEIVALDHGESGGAYAVTTDGTFLLSVGEGWNHQILGLRGVRAVAAP